MISVGVMEILNSQEPCVLRWSKAPCQISTPSWVLQRTRRSAHLASIEPCRCILHPSSAASIGCYESVKLTWRDLLNSTADSCFWNLSRKGGHHRGQDRRS